MSTDEYQAKIHADRKRRWNGRLGWIVAAILVIAVGYLAYRNRGLERAQVAGPQPAAKDPERSQILYQELKERQHRLEEKIDANLGRFFDFKATVQLEFERDRTEKEINEARNKGDDPKHLLKMLEINKEQLARIEEEHKRLEKQIEEDKRELRQVVSRLEAILGEPVKAKFK
jgi:hypothetical protein